MSVVFFLVSLAGFRGYSPVVILLFFLVVAIGTGLLLAITQKKWGYTEKREQELEQVPEFLMGSGSKRKKKMQKTGKAGKRRES